MDEIDSVIRMIQPIYILWGQSLLGLFYHTHWDTGIQGYRDTGIQRCRDTEIQGYRDTGIQGYRDTGIPTNYEKLRVRFIQSIFLYSNFPMAFRFFNF